MTIMIFFATQPVYILFLELGDELIRTFDKINSHRTYQLEKDTDNNISLVVNVTKGKKQV
jgi:hypothetical protein